MNLPKSPKDLSDTVREYGWLDE